MAAGSDLARAAGPSGSALKVGLRFMARMLGVEAPEKMGEGRSGNS